MNLSFAMFMRKTNAGIVLQGFIAAEAVQPTPIIFMEALRMRMISAARCRRSGLSVQS